MASYSTGYPTRSSERRRNVTNDLLTKNGTESSATIFVIVLGNCWPWSCGSC